MKTPDEGLAHLLSLLGGKWQYVLQSTIRSSLYDIGHLVHCGTLGGAEIGMQNCSDQFDLMLEVSTQWVMRQLPQLFQYPTSAASVLCDDLDDREVACETACAHCWALQHFEKLVVMGSTAAKYVLDDVTWAGNQLCRLFLHMVVQESTLANALWEFTLYLARAMNVRVPDEKMPEDVHQHVRDTTRIRRHKNIPMHTVFAAQQDSGVLDARKLTSPSVSPLEVARKSWQSMQTREQTRFAFTSQPKDWPASFNGILRPARDWPSATVPTHAQSLLAWQWILVAGEDT